MDNRWDFLRGWGQRRRLNRGSLAQQILQRMNAEILQRLCQFDTPTVCNGLELIDDNRRNFGYTVENFVGINSTIGPVCGLVKTASCRSLERGPFDITTTKLNRLKYYEYINEGNCPKIVAMQDLDGSAAGRGAFWGEFNARVHLALGCIGVVTDGSFRDVQSFPPELFLLGRGLRPSHANIHIESYGCQVNVSGMVVCDGDVIHADEHGCVCFPVSLSDVLYDKCLRYIESETPILDACRVRKLNLNLLKDLYLRR